MPHLTATRLVVFSLMGLIFPPHQDASAQQNIHRNAPRSRNFRLDYGATLNQLPVGARVRVWLPLPPSNDHQTIQAMEPELPVPGKVFTEPIYGNQILYFETQAPPSGRLLFNTAYLVQRHEVCGMHSKENKIQLTDYQRNLFLSANSKVPLNGRPLDLLADIPFSSDPLVLARTLYERVDEHVRYDKSQPGYGNGDVLWVCDSRFGNCTDFHSLFISWARSKGLPARFEIGFAIASERGAGSVDGYHCWALFYHNEKGWIPVDISEADKHPQKKEYFFGNLTEDRVTFTVGRDIQLVPQPKGGPLNYFVYPYVEVDGKPWPSEKMSPAFSYVDVQRKPIP